MKQYFRQIKWFFKDKNGELKLDTVQFALIQAEDGYLQMAAVIDVPYYGITESLTWEATRLFIKPEIIGLEGLKKAVKENLGLTIMEQETLMGVWENFFKLLEHWQKGFYPVEYWEYCQDKFSVKIKRQESNTKIILEAIDQLRKVYDELDATGYNLDVADLPNKNLQIRDAW